MVFKKRIESVINIFYLVTNTPIQAYDYSGYLIDSKGYENRFEKYFDKYDVYNTIKDSMKEENNYKTITIGNNIYYSAISICPRGFNRGIFFIGPYSIEKNNDFSIVYKPKEIIDYMLNFLRNIYMEKTNLDSFSTNKNNQAYSLHIKKTLDYVDARYNEPISLDKISDYLNLNKSYFCSLFKEETGKTFTEYLNNFRINKSKALIVEGELSILDIALAVGFNNQNYFNITFKKVTGMTPLEYRKEFINKKDPYACPFHDIMPC